MLDLLWPARSNAPPTSSTLSAEIDALDTWPSSSGKGKRTPSSRGAKMVQRIFPPTRQGTTGDSRARQPPPHLVISPSDDDAQDVDDEDDAETPTFPLAGSIQRAPPSTVLSPPPSTTVKPAKPRRKVVLEPGYSQLDWARLKASGANLRGNVEGFLRITPSELARHRSKDDVWAAFQGRVYNITPYLKFHPGGVPQLMKAAGRDGTELFMRTHAWVSIDAMLGEACIGVLVREPA